MSYSCMQTVKLAMGEPVTQKDYMIAFARACEEANRNKAEADKWKARFEFLAKHSDLHRVPASQQWFWGGHGSPYPTPESAVDAEIDARKGKS